MLHKALGGEVGTFVEARLLIMERNGYPEETYYTWSYTPIPGDDGSAGGIFCANSDDTGRVIAERQLTLLRELAANSANARGHDEACRLSLSALSSNDRDLPFALIYLADPEKERFSLAGTTGMEPGHAAAPAHLTFESGNSWPLREVMHSGEALAVETDRLRMEMLPQGPWDRPPSQAVVLPISSGVEKGRVGALIVGLNPFRRFDEGYRTFLALVCTQISVAMVNAQAYEEERRRSEALAELDRAKTVFFSNISHEFRTPLTLMLGPVEETLSDPGVPVSVRKKLEPAHRNSLRLLKLVNNLLDFSRIEAGRAEASYEPTDIAALTRDLASTFRAAIEGAGVAFRVDCASLDEPVYLDRGMWEKIVLNLLSNAFKYTLTGTITVATFRREREAILEVTDTGVGIPTLELPRIFERFHRIEGSHGRTQEGSGIGLALVHELAKLHGGTVEVASEINHGSTFRVRMPLGRAHLPAVRIRDSRKTGPGANGARAYVQEALRWLPESAEGRSAAMPTTTAGTWRTPEAATTAISGARIVLADDNADMRRYVQELLAPLYEIEAVADGEQALAAIRRTRPDLVIADVMMPRLDGFGLLRALRADGALRKVPVLLLSARAGEESRIEGLEAGADDYLVKPFLARELTARVGTTLALAHIRREFEQRLAKDLEVMTRLRELGERCSRHGADPEHCLQGILDLALFITSADRGNIQLLDAASGTLRIVLQRGFEPPFLHFFAGVRPGEAAACSSAMLGSERVVVADVETSALFAGTAARGVLLEAGVRAVQSTPLMSGSRTLGMLSTHHARPHQLADRELQMLDLLARQAADYLERRAADEALRTSEAALRDADRRKDEFLAMLAHELRNPLSPIRNANELLSRILVSTDTRVHGAIDVTRRQIDQLSRLVDDLLDVSRVTQGRIELQRQPTELSHIVAQAVETVQPLMREKSHRLSVLTSGQPRLYVSADPARLTQCVVNILTNATKFTDAGGEIRVSTRGEGTRAVIEVSDNGSGISPGLLPRIFDLFVQGECTLARTQGGLGVGLAVVKQLVEMHHGEVRAASAGEGLGSVFQIRLPLIDAPVFRESRIEAPRIPAVRVLIVDDNQDAANALATLLRLEGHEVHTAYSAAAALEQAARIQPDLMLLDIGLPEMNGYEVARKLRDLPALRESRLVAVSGYGQPEDRARTRAAGFDAHLVKPVSLTALARALADL